MRSLNPHPLNIATPPWVKEICPQLPALLPKEVVEEICKFKKHVEGETLRYKLNAREQFEYTISSYLNNFILLIVDRDYKDKNAIPRRDKSPKFPISEKLRSKTWGEFYTDIDSAVARTINSTPKDIKNLDEEAGRTNINIRLLPAFVELRKEGYNRYPDLAL